MTKLKNKEHPKVGSRALGKKAPYQGYAPELMTDGNGNHYRQALLEAADEIEQRDRRFYTFPWIESLVKKLRISAGVE